MTKNQDGELAASYSRPDARPPCTAMAQSASCQHSTQGIHQIVLFCARHDEFIDVWEWPGKSQGAETGVIPSVPCETAANKCVNPPIQTSQQVNAKQHKTCHLDAPIRKRKHACAHLLAAFSPTQHHVRKTRDHEHTHS